MSTTRISLWSGPRNISTALMYSFAQRSDTQVYDEPLYAHYLCHSDARAYHPGAEAILDSQENDGEKVVTAMLSDASKPVLFFKNMAHHLQELDRSFMQEMVNVLLTRDPREMLPSFARVVDTPTLDDVGYKILTDLADELHRRQFPVVVLEAKAVLLNPEKELRRLCSLAEIPFDPGMLHWPAGPRPEDGVWAKYWYESVHRSTGFQKYQPKTEPFPDQLRPLLAECMPYYEQLRSLAKNSESFR